MGSEDLKVLVDGLRSNKLLDDYTHLLTGKHNTYLFIYLLVYLFFSLGYIGSKSFLEEVLSVVKELKENCPGLVYGRRGFYVKICFHTS